MFGGVGGVTNAILLSRPDPDLAQFIASKLEYQKQFSAQHIGE